MDMDDEEATSISIDENEERVPLSQFELAKATKKRFDVLSEDLVGEEEEVECPECGKECDGGNGLKRHISMKHGKEVSHESCGTYLGTDEIFEEISKSSSFSRGTVERLLTIARTPSQFIPFLKIPEERDNSEKKVVEETIGKDFTFANQNREYCLQN